MSVFVHKLGSTCLCFWLNSKTICHGRWKWPSMGRCPYVVRIAADIVTRAVPNASEATEALEEPQ